MSVDPLQSRAVPSAEPSRIAASEQVRRQEAVAEKPLSEAPPVSGDSVELSAASRGLVDQANEAGAVPQGTVSSERMQTVLRRLADGFYDGTDVRTEVARRAGLDLDNSNAGVSTT
jgi:hypothetical protein